MDYFSFTYFRYYANAVVTTNTTFTMQNSHCSKRTFGQPKYSTPFLKKKFLLCISLWDHYCPRSMVALMFYSHCSKIFTSLLLSIKYSFERFLLFHCLSVNFFFKLIPNIRKLHKENWTCLLRQVHNPVLSQCCQKPQMNGSDKDFWMIVVN